MNIESAIFSKYGIRLNNLETFVMTDQPCYCSNCNGRTDILEELVWKGYTTHLCRCNNEDCRFVFIEQEDNYFTVNYWLEESRT